MFVLCAGIREEGLRSPQRLKRPTWVCRQRFSAGETISVPENARHLSLASELRRDPSNLNRELQVRPYTDALSGWNIITLAYVGGDIMLYWALVFLVIAIIAALFGFGVIASAAAGIAKMLFFIFLVVFVISLIFGLSRRGTGV